MKAKSAHAKGSRYENWLVEDLRKDLDSKTHRTVGSGSGLDKNDINIPAFDIEIEAKNQKTIKLIDWWEQSRRQAMRTTVLAIRNPKKPEFNENLIVMDYEDWKELVKAQNDTINIVNNKSRTLKFKLSNLKTLIGGIMRELEDE